MSLFYIRRKIIAIMLIAALALPAAGYAAEIDETGAKGAEAASELQTEEAAELPSDAEEADDEAGTVEEAEADAGSADEASAEEESASEPEAAPEQKAAVPEGPEVRTAEEPEEIQKIDLNAAGDDGMITVVWKPVTDAEYYMAYLDDAEQGVKIDMTVPGARCRTVFYYTDSRRTHKVTIKAFKTEIPVVDPPEKKGEDPQPDPQPDPEPEEVLIGEGSMEGISAVSRSGLTSGTRSGTSLGINLKTLLGESYDGYSVVQGGCTDGTYAYYLMVSSSNQNGRILKTNVSDNSVVGRSGVIDIEHGNGMAIDTANNRLVIIGREDWRNKITTVDAGSLSNVKYYDVDYSGEGKWQSSKSKGLSAISYLKDYDCFIALQRSSHDLLVLDSNFKVTGFIGTKITAKYPGMYQGIDADDRYVYLLLSYDSSKQPDNLILVLDWNRENLGINTDWRCGNDDSGEPDAVLTLDTPYEAENIYHIERGDGTSDFYISEYYNNPKTKYKKKKVKWKKVKKKVKVKWKKVKKKVKWKKVNGKWKYKTKKVWKYKYKTKKVWKYKYKKVKVGTYYNRDDYVYYLGRF